MLLRLFGCDKSQGVKIVITVSGVNFCCFCYIFGENVGFVKEYFRLLNAPTHYYLFGSIYHRLESITKNAITVCEINIQASLMR